MKRIRLWLCIFPYLLITMLLTSCGDKVTGGPGTAWCSSERL